MRTEEIITKHYDERVVTCTCDKCGLTAREKIEEIDRENLETRKRLKPLYKKLYSGWL